MRIFKFNAWDKVNGNMLYDVSTGTITIWSVPDRRSAKSDDCIFLQYTELKDKNKKEIYEGDIIRLSDYESYSSEYLDSLISHTGVVRWVKTGCEYWVDLLFPENKVTASGEDFLKLVETDWSTDVEDDAIANQWEIIGNIYENKDLIKNYGKLNNKI